jgi:hypothetical protein
MATDQRPGFYPKYRPDIRVERLVVSIMQCDLLKYYYLATDKMDLACRYNAIGYTPFESVDHYSSTTPQDSLGMFFDQLRNNPAKFAGFMTYTLRNMFLESSLLSDWSPKDKAFFSDFENDLLSLGFKVDIGIGDNVSVTPTVIGGPEDTRILDELDKMLTKLDPQLVETRRGAWDALLSRSADKETQSMSSSRKLLLDTVKLAGKGKRPEDQIRSILGGKEISVIRTSVEFLISIYDTQSNGVHGTLDLDTAILVIKLTEYGLYFLLKSRTPGTIIGS